jgi:hypothetical protein
LLANTRGLEDEEQRERKESPVFMGALIKTVCPGLVETPSRESCVGGFVPSSREKIRGFHDSLGQKQSSLFILSLG